MANTTNILLNIPAHGGFIDSWDVPVNGDFSSLDGFLGGVQAINAAGSSPITLTAPTGSVTPAGGPTQAENAVLRFSGALTGNVRITLPLPGPMIVHNLTTGNFVLSFRAVGSGLIIAIEQGTAQRIYNDGTNVYFVDLPPVGSYLDVCDATLPAWISGCSVLPYLNCDGSSFSAVTYPYLANKLGGTTLPDLRGTARYTLNQGTSRLTSAGSGLDGDTRFAIKTTQTQTLGTANLPPYTPSFPNIAIWDGNVITFQVGTGGFVAAPNANFMSKTNSLNPQGGTTTPFGLTSTGTVSGITLIRAV